MGFWDFLLGKQTWVEDDLFGRLRFFAGGKTGSSYFEGEKLFSPTGYSIELAIDGELPGPTPARGRPEAPGAGGEAPAAGAQGGQQQSSAGTPGAPPG